AEPSQEEDPFANLLSLKLHKPAHWNWELTTSRSCSNIALPRILLYDHTGALLVDANSQTELSYRSHTLAPTPTPTSTPTTTTAGGTRSGARSQAGSGIESSVGRHRKRAATANLGQCLRQALHTDFHGLHIAEATPSTTPTTRSPSRLHGGSCIDFSTHELPNYTEQRPLSSERRSSSLRGVRFHEAEQPTTYPTPPSTSTLTTTANSSSSGPREKRRYRRSHSSGRVSGSSILERFSMTRGRYSSPEYATEEQLQHAPRYYLRSSKAGTLVIKDDSFSRVRQRRRRPRHSSTENVLNESTPSRSVLVTTTAAAAVATLGAAAPLPAMPLPAMPLSNGRKRGCSTQRRQQSATHRLSTSEEEEQGRDEARGRRPQRRYGKNLTKELITVDPENCVYRATTAATAR
ncbi:uncharacterized protein LOC115627966, partial [Scaptodrosophila lebanonensis]|uniref:Uncharacterized protein LOC115627966 n=1 Tax=Drosophila lebanonensis TaxID=7225 RepID=A0A6J2TVZ2_DROLE